MSAIAVGRMASAIAPVPIRESSISSNNSSFFDLPHRKRKQKRIVEEERRQRVAQEAYEESRAEAWTYLLEFLQSSERWCNIMDQITIVWEAVPTMDELESYGGLDEQEGTRACRKLFKAVVVWDELGHSLWMLLHSVAEHKQRAFDAVVKDASWTSMSGYSATDNSAISSRRSSRRASEDSSLSSYSRESLHNTMSVSVSSSPSGKSHIPRIFSRRSSRR